MAAIAFVVGVVGKPEVPERYRSRRAMPAGPSLVERHGDTPILQRLGPWAPTFGRLSGDSVSTFSRHRSNIRPNPIQMLFDNFGQTLVYSVWRANQDLAVALPGPLVREGLMCRVSVHAQSPHEQGWPGFGHSRTGRGQFRPKFAWSHGPISSGIGPTSANIGQHRSIFGFRPNSPRVDPGPADFRLDVVRVWGRNRPASGQRRPTSGGFDPKRVLARVGPRAC